MTYIDLVADLGSETFMDHLNRISHFVHGPIGVLLVGASIAGAATSSPLDGALAPGDFYIGADSAVVTDMPGGVAIATLLGGVKVTIDSSRSEFVCASASGWILSGDAASTDSADTPVIVRRGADLWDLGGGPLSWCASPPVRIGRVLAGARLEERGRSPSVVEVRCKGWLPVHALTADVAGVKRFRRHYGAGFPADEATMISTSFPHGTDPAATLAPIVEPGEWVTRGISVRRTGSSVTTMRAIVHGPDSDGWQPVSSDVGRSDSVLVLLGASKQCDFRSLWWNGRASLEITFDDGAVAVISATDSDMIFYSDNTGYVGERTGGVTELGLSSQDLSNFVWTLARASRGGPGGQEAPSRSLGTPAVDR